MLIECSFCHATAKLPDDKEGAKVRCSECGKVYVAREQGSKPKGRRGMDPATIAIAAAALVGIIIFAVMANNHKPPPPPPPPVVAKLPEVIVDTTGWDSEIVRTVRGVYEAAFAVNEGALINTLDGSKIAKRLAEADPTQAVDFDALDPVAKETFLQGIAQEMMRGTDENAPHFWKAVDGKVLPNSFDLLDVIVRITADKRLEDGSTSIAESRTFDWKLYRVSDKAKWKAWSWERFITDEERRLARAKKPKMTKITLEDGTSLFQAEMRHIDPYPGTPPEQVAQIEKTVATMLDFSLRPKENSLAQDELVAIGKPAIPMLLNKFYEIKIVDSEDDPSLTQVNMVNVTLRRITNYDSGFTPMPGQNEQRREIALKAWFAWWDRKGKNFTAPAASKDLLEEMIVPTERDKRELEKEKAKGGGR